MSIASTLSHFSSMAHVAHTSVFVWTNHLCISTLILISPPKLSLNYQNQTKTFSRVKEGLEDGLALEGGGEGGRGSEVWWSRTMSMRWDGREVAARERKAGARGEREEARAKEVRVQLEEAPCGDSRGGGEECGDDRGGCRGGVCGWVGCGTTSQDRSHTCHVRDRPPQLCIDRKAEIYVNFACPIHTVRISPTR